FFFQVTLVLPLLLLLNKSSAQCLTGNDSPMISTVTRKSIIDSRFIFALDTLKQMAQIETRDNIFYSPYSIHQALTLAYYGARDSTETALRKTLHLPNDLSKPDMMRFYSLEKSGKDPVFFFIQNSSNYEYNSANRIWISDTRKVENCMLDLFSSELEKIDFHTNPSAVRDYMNNWVSNMTKGHIHDLFSADSITADTDLVLANAVYFKGQWQSRFDPANSVKGLFHTSQTQQSMVTFMKQKGNFNHFISETLAAHILELPYKGNEVSMFILLPPYHRSTVGDSKQVGERDSIRQVIERIFSAPDFMELRELLDSKNVLPQEVEIFLPKFTIEKDLPLAVLLHALGVAELVTPGRANLRGFVADGEKPLHLGDAVHRARIEVTEEGTTAAAATALLSFRSGRPLQPALFKADHPFLYFIYEKPTRTILFCGIYRSPNPQQTTAETS
ncbi:Serpin B11, partial [Eufriesea mexicana]